VSHFPSWPCRAAIPAVLAAGMTKLAAVKRITLPSRHLREGGDPVTLRGRNTEARQKKALGSHVRGNDGVIFIPFAQHQHLWEQQGQFKEIMVCPYSCRADQTPSRPEANQHPLINHGLLPITRCRTLPDAAPGRESSIPAPYEFLLTHIAQVCSSGTIKYLVNPEPWRRLSKRRRPPPNTTGARAISSSSMTPRFRYC